MVVGHVYQQEKVCFSGKAASVFKLSIQRKRLNYRELWSMKGNGIRFIIAANCDVLPPPKHCSQGEDPACSYLHIPLKKQQP